METLIQRIYAGLILLTLLMPNSATAAGWPQGVKIMRAAEIAGIYAGNTEILSERNGKYYYFPDGRVEGIDNDRYATGKWSVRHGEFCILMDVFEMQGSRPILIEKGYKYCELFRKTAEGKVWVRTRRSEPHPFSARIRKGNPHAKAFNAARHKYGQ